MKELVLYNHFHNGDIFYSRVLINVLLEKYKIKTSVEDTPLVRDYSFTTEKNYGQIDGALKKVSGITYSLFDIFKNSYGIRVKYGDKSEKKQQEVLKVLQTLEVVLR